MSKLCAEKSKSAPYHTENLQIIVANKRKSQKNTEVKKVMLIIGTTYLLENVQLT